MADDDRDIYDDVEIVRKGSALCNYLKENGFHEFEVSDDKCIASYKNDESAYSYDSNTACPYLQCQLNTILKSNLLFPEDSLFLQNFLHDKVASDRSRWIIMFNTVAVIGLLSVLSVKNLRCKIGVPIAFGLSSLTAYCIKEGLELYTNSLNSKTTLQLADLLYELFLLVKKSLLFIQENEFLGTNSCVKTIDLSWLGYIKNNTERKPIHSYYQLHSLRITVGSVLVNIVALFADSTVKLIKIMPLSMYADGSCQYLSQVALQRTKDKKCVSTLEELNRLYNFYLLLQSEFLKRFALCFCPEHWLNGSKAQWPIVFDVAKNIITHCRKLLHNLKAEYTSHYVPSSEERKVLYYNKIIHPVYSDLIVAMHSLELHFNSLLIQSRIFQDLLEVRVQKDLNYKEPWEALDDVDNKLSTISKEFQSCQNCLQVAQKVLMKTKLKCPNVEENESEVVNESMPPGKNVIHKTGLIVGKSNFEPQSPDQVFLAISDARNEEHLNEDANDVCYNDEQMEVTKNVLEELKEVLKSKQMEWKEREQKALGSKVLPFSISDLNEETKIGSLFNSSVTEDLQSDIAYRVSMAPSRITLPTTSSFTMQIAEASAAWNLSNAENFSTYGETDDESGEEGNF